MKREELREYIKNNLLNKNKKLNSNSIKNGKLKKIEKELEDFSLGDSLKEKLFIIYHNIKRIPICKECGENVKFISFAKGYTSYCSPKCSGKQSKKIIKNKYNVDNVFQLKEVKEKIKQTNLQKYGVDNPYKFGSKRHKKIIKNKYNVDNVFQLKEVKEKIKQTNLQKYGIKHNSYNKKTLAKRKNTRLYSFYHNIDERVQNKVKPLFSLNEYIGINNKYEWKCAQCGVIFKDHLDDGRIPKCPACYPKLTGYSRQEKEVVEWLQSLNYNVEENNRNIINPYEVDIYLSDYNLAIEYNGLYWHSREADTPKNYHQNKVQMCYDKGIRLLHIWEDEWLNKKEEIKEKILYYIQNKHILIKPQEPRLVIKEGFNIWI